MKAVRAWFWECGSEGWVWEGREEEKKKKICRQTKANDVIRLAKGASQHGRQERKTRGGQLSFFLGGEHLFLTLHTHKMQMGRDSIYKYSRVWKSWVHCEFSPSISPLPEMRAQVKFACSVQNEPTVPHQRPFSPASPFFLPPSTPAISDL